MTDYSDETLIQLLRERATDFALDNKTDLKQHICWIAAERLTALLAGVPHTQRMTIQGENR